jgi:hypothetical protein
MSYYFISKISWDCLCEMNEELKDDKIIKCNYKKANNENKSKFFNY